jgi:hypothetical protein
MVGHREGVLLMLRFDQIVREVLRQPMPCGAYVTYREVMSHRRARPFVEARNLICVLTYRFMRDPSSPKIGRLLNREYSTVLHSLQMVRLNEAYYQATLDRLTVCLGKLEFAKSQSRQQAILTMQEVAA